MKIFEGSHDKIDDSYTKSVGGINIRTNFERQFHTFEEGPPRIDDSYTKNVGVLNIRATPTTKYVNF